MHSLQARLAAGLLVTVLVLFAVQWFVVSMSLRTLTEEYFASRLNHDVESLLAGLDFDAGNRPVISADYAGPIFHRPFSGHYFKVVSGTHAILSRSLWDFDLPVEQLPVGQRKLVRTRGPQDQPLVMLLASFEKRGQVLTIAVAEDYSPIEGQYNAFQWQYVLITVFMLVGLIALQMWVVRRGLRPLEQVRGDVRRLERGEIEHLRSAVPAEVIPLVDEINHLIGIMSERLQRSRHALGNLAHALKTPLTALDQLINSAEVQAHPELHAQLRRQSGIIGGYVQRELKRARLAGAATPGRRFNLNQELPPLIAALKQIYNDKQPDLQLHMPSNISYSAEREDMLELFGNLLDNACKWTKKKVVLQVADEPGLSFSIDDDGPGAPQDKLEQLSARGVRLDESIGGHGLGLSIAREIVMHYGGEMGFEQSPGLGGFKVWVRLPAIKNVSSL